MDLGRKSSVRSTGFVVPAKSVALADFAFARSRLAFALRRFETKLQRLRPWHPERAGFADSWRTRNRAPYQRARRFLCRLGTPGERRDPASPLFQTVSGSLLQARALYERTLRPLPSGSVKRAPP